MTRGRKPGWANTPLAQWLREQLGDREKQWLTDQLIERGKGRNAAEGLVNRWTARGEPASPAHLKSNSIAVLTAIFGEEPPGAAAVADLAANVETLRTEVAELRQRVDTLAAEPPRDGRPQAPVSQKR